MISTVVGIVVAVVVAFSLMGILFLLAYFIEKKLNNSAARGNGRYGIPITGIVGRRGAVVVGAIRPVQRSHLARTWQNHPAGLSVQELDAMAPSYMFGQENNDEKLSTELTMDYYESEEKGGSSCDGQGGPPSPRLESKEEGGERNNDYCAICLEEFEPDALVRRLPCKHLFHSQELERWFAKSNFCPICRVEFAPRDKQAVTRTVETN
ncbi:hypothetical protein GAYE_SCF61G6526 [Galdieria yellowstonensis]|jgi:hypothetical protein|uniref:RING-type domain-containing protein n=1 Tax=Galdieria yellowstonensis TaxID=3028027 RepID=A0AAV9IME2_9RHOD|nr:hypothetical protein GAYE_SCF61G6526 [Galdieria yellowstonensis]